MSTTKINLLLRFIDRAIRRDGFWCIAGITAVLIGGVYLSSVFWEDLRGHRDSLSTTVRNVGLVIGGIIAMLLAVWRSRVAERQVATSQQGLLNERYQEGAQMLGSEVLSVRLGGIYALERLATEHPEQYHVQIIKLFCAFARHPAKDDGSQSTIDEEENPRHNTPRLREDVAAVMEAIRVRSKVAVELERSNCLRIGLSSADSRDARLMKADLSRAVLTGADLSGARLDDADLSGAWLDGANLSGARLGGANLSGADLWSTNLSGAFLVQGLDDEEDETSWRPAKGLTQESLNRACADKPPQLLDRVIDAESGKALEWCGGPCNEQP